MIHPVTETCQLFAPMRRDQCFCREPGVAEILRDPITQALMAADRVNRRDLETLLVGASQKLNGRRPF
jgi:hypothetical protein